MARQGKRTFQQAVGRTWDERGATDSSLSSRYIHLICIVFVYALSTINYDEIELKSHLDVNIYLPRAKKQIKPETV
jgi:hypothetical protein